MIKMMMTMMIITNCLLTLISSDENENEKEHTWPTYVSEWLFSQMAEI